ncbi:unnamed protein product [Rotaria sordida]|uniref:Centrosomin N-terminal motif 1 domain-containing protein n=1 Tax=Rotaria sordida TaxID=392033 RepID=A0A813PUK7_9BILA|nr:unnamed protein product [Rotaria sordida]
MDTIQQEDDLSIKSDESLSIPVAIPGLTPSTNPRTMREYDTEFQELKRENFDLKLRIFFLEEQNELALDSRDISSTTIQRHRRFHPTQYEQGDQQEISIIGRSTNESYQASSSSRHQQGTQVSNIQLNDENDELHQLKTELERYHQENAKLRELLRNSGEFGENITTSTVDQHIQTITSHADSTSDRAMPVNQYTLQFNERERNFQEENNSLKQEITALKSRLIEANNILEEVNQRYKEEQIKADRVLRRLKADYDTRIANMEAEYQQKLATYESYRHEPLLARIRFSYPLQEQTSSNVNVEEYLRTIDQQSRTIKDLENQIAEFTKWSYPVPTHSHLTEENFQRLNDKLTSYVKTVENLRAECDELRRSEKHLRLQVAKLLRLLDPSISSSDLPPLPRPLSTAVTDTQQVENPEATVAQVTVQLRNVADDVSGLTNRISKIKRDYDDSQTLIRKQETQIQQYEVRASEIEKQTRETFNLKIEAFEQEKKNLAIQIEERDRRLREITSEIDQIRSQVIRELEIQYTREIQTLQEQNEQQKTQLEQYLIKHREMENNFQQERIHLERERDFERGKVNQIQIELDTSIARNKNLETQNDQSQSIIVEQQTKIGNQSQNFQSQITQIETERNNLNDELQLVKHEKQTMKDQLYEYETEFTRLTQSNDELNEQITVYEVRLRGSEADKNRYQNELNILQRSTQSTKEQFETLQSEIQELKYQLDNLEIRIRLEINQEYENDYRRRYSQLSETKEVEIENLEKEYQTIQSTLEERNNAITRLDSQLQILENELRKANTRIQTYESEIEHVRIERNRTEEVRQQIKDDLSRQYTNELNIRNDHIKRLENQNQAYETQITQYKQQLTILPDNINRREKELHEKNILIQKLRDDLSVVESERKDIRIPFEIRIQQLEQDLQTKQQLIRTYSESLKTKAQHIEKLLDDIKKGDYSNSNTIETLQQELLSRDRRIDELINEKSLTIHESERYISELRLNIQDYERKLIQTNDQLQLAERKIDTLQYQLGGHIRNHNSLDINFNIAAEEKEIQLERVRYLENQLEMLKKINSGTSFEQRDHCQSIIDDLKDKLKQREKIVQDQNPYSNIYENLQNSLRHCNEELNNVRQAHDKLQSDCNQVTVRNERMAKQHTSDIENRDQLIATIRQKLSDKDQEINRLHEININNEKKITELHSKLINIEPNLDSTRSSSERVSTNPALQIEIQKKDQEIIELRSKLAEALRSTTQPASSSTTSVFIPVTRARVHANFDHLNREELLYELERALQYNEELNEQLKQKNPSITELHTQLVETRHELSRQKYVNQVLWRKLNALIDIHGSNTRAELALELVNYQDELAKLKSQQNRTNDVRSAKLNAHSRSSSEQYLCSLHNDMSSTNIELPTKNIKSTIALLERSNIEWQTKLARLTEQLGRSENQSRNYHRELTKYQKILYEAGLIESSVRQRRHSADDSAIIGRNESTKINDDLTEIENINELREIIRNQRKFIQQLQMRVRINTPDIIKSPTIDKLQQQIQNLNLVIETYKDESNLLKTELKKLYKTIEHNRKTQQNYEKILKEQQTCIEQTKKKLNKYEQFFKKYDNHLPIFDERKEHIINPLDEYIIDLDIDVLQGNDTKKKTSVSKRDSALSSASDTNELQRQINEKDEQIRTLNNDINRKGDQIQQLTIKLTQMEKVNGDAEHRYHTESDRIRQDLTVESRKIENELQQARLQIDSLKTYKIRFDQAEEKNQQLHNEIKRSNDEIKRSKDEIKRLQDEIERNESVIEHYKTQISILERKTFITDSDTSEIAIRKSELSQLLEEMRLLRRDLERSIEKQKQLQAKLDENIRQSQSPREFKFSGHGVSYPDLRVIGTSSSVGAENLSSSFVIDEQLSRPVGSSTIELEHIEYSQQSAEELVPRIPIRSYIVGELKTHDDLRRLIQDIKFDLKAVLPELKDQLRSRTNSSTRSLEERLNQLDGRLTHALDLIETYWKADLPEKNKYNEHIFIDHRLIEENKRLLFNQRKYIQDLRFLKQKYREQSNYLEQLLAQLTKVNRKKADTGEYLALLLQPTLDVLQKARSNIEHHLKESNTNNIPPGSAQTHRRHRSNRKD